MNQELHTLLTQAAARFDALKARETKSVTYGSSFTSPIDSFHWNNPNLIWLLTTNNEEGWEGSQTQIGMTRDARLVWEYQSHCSCDSYEDSTVIGNEFPPTTTKSFELNAIPLDWEAQIVKNLTNLLAL